jgi:hypothetical protein
MRPPGATPKPRRWLYHSNRAAAYCSQKKYQEAVDDCEACIGLCPDYLKAHARLGLALFFLERYEESVAAYERTLELEPATRRTGQPQAGAQQTEEGYRRGLEGLQRHGPSGGMDGLPAGIPPGMMKNFARATGDGPGGRARWPGSAHEGPPDDVDGAADDEGPRHDAAGHVHAGWRRRRWGRRHARPVGAGRDDGRHGWHGRWGPSQQQQRRRQEAVQGL